MQVELRHWSHLILPAFVDQTNLSSVPHARRPSSPIFAKYTHLCKFYCNSISPSITCHGFVFPTDVHSRYILLIGDRMDYGHEVGHHWDPQIESYRGALEAMLGNTSSSNTHQTSQSTIGTPTPITPTPIPPNINPTAWMQKVRDFGHDGMQNLRELGEQARDMRDYAGEQARNIRSHVNEHGIIVNVPVDLTPNPNVSLAPVQLHPGLNRGFSFYAGAGNGQGQGQNVSASNMEKGGMQSLQYGTIPYGGGGGGDGGNGNGRPVSGQMYGGQAIGVSGYDGGSSGGPAVVGGSTPVPTRTMTIDPGGIGTDSASMSERTRISMH